MSSNTSGKPPAARPAAFLATAALALTLAASAWAGPGRAVSQTPEGVRDAEPGSAAGVNVAIDAATGKFRQPTPEELKALDSSFKAMFGNAVAAPEAKVWADGTVSLELTNDYLNVWVVKINPDGSLSQSCVTGLDEANAFVAGGAAAAEER